MQVANAKPEQRAAKLKFVWINQILPLLYEYFYRQRDTLARLLSDMGSQREDYFLDGIQTEEDLFFLLWNLSKQ
jgi:hypothetical protein